MSQTTITSGAGNNQDNNISAESDKIESKKKVWLVS